MAHVTTGSGSMAARADVAGTMAALADGSGALAAAADESGSALYCSESLPCSESLACTDHEGAAVVTSASGSMVAA